MICDCEFVEIKFQIKASRNTGFSAKTPTYRSWANMRSRCYLEKLDNYKYYGGRGIRVSLEWFKSFPCFLSDMGKRPDISFSLDRINGSKSYCKHNCRWATKVEQMINRKLPKHSKWGTGVTPARSGCFRVRIKNREIGIFKTQKEAEEAYRREHVGIYKEASEFFKVEYLTKFEIEERNKKETA